MAESPRYVIETLVLIGAPRRYGVVDSHKDRRTVRVEMFDAREDAERRAVELETRYRAARARTVARLAADARRAAR